jgi:uncharacterized protein YndB with AHSA1/START domain
MEDRIEKRIELNAPVARVWRALTDYREFGEWFRVKLEGPFVPGQIARGQITHPGYEHVVWQATVQKMEPQRLFSFTWRPYAIDSKVDYSGNRRPLSNSGWKRPRPARCSCSRNQALPESRATDVPKRIA